jgi:hypothetical protein
MAEPLSPLEIAGITILVTNAARQLDTLMTAMVTPAQYDEVPRLRTTAVNAAKLARRALGNFIKRSGEVRT